MAGKQFEKVDCSRGAPMGRICYGLPQNQAKGTVRLFRVFLDGDYDDGGAYWGAGEPLWCALSKVGEYRQFIRAPNRLEAAKLLNLRQDQLILKGIRK